MATYEQYLQSVIPTNSVGPQAPDLSPFASLQRGLHRHLKMRSQQDADVVREAFERKASQLDATSPDYMTKLQQAHREAGAAAGQGWLRNPYARSIFETAVDPMEYGSAQVRQAAPQIAGSALEELYGAMQEVPLDDPHRLLKLQTLPAMFTPPQEEARAGFDRGALLMLQTEMQNHPQRVAKAAADRVVAKALQLDPNHPDRYDEIERFIREEMPTDAGAQAPYMQMMDGLKREVDATEWDETSEWLDKMDAEFDRQADQWDPSDRHGMHNNADEFFKDMVRGAPSAHAAEKGMIMFKAIHQNAENRHNQWKARRGQRQATAANTEGSRDLSYMEDKKQKPEPWEEGAEDEAPVVQQMAKEIAAKQQQAANAGAGQDPRVLADPMAETPGLPRPPESPAAPMQSGPATAAAMEQITAPPAPGRVVDLPQPQAPFTPTEQMRTALNNDTGIPMELLQQLPENRAPVMQQGPQMFSPEWVAQQQAAASPPLPTQATLQAPALPPDLGPAAAEQRAAEATQASGFATPPAPEQQAAAPAAEAAPDAPEVPRFPYQPRSTQEQEIMADYPVAVNEFLAEAGLSKLPDWFPRNRQFKKMLAGFEDYVQNQGIGDTIKMMAIHQAKINELEGMLAMAHVEGQGDSVPGWYKDERPKVNASAVKASIDQVQAKIDKLGHPNQDWGFRDPEVTTKRAERLLERKGRELTRIVRVRTIADIINKIADAKRDGSFDPILEQTRGWQAIVSVSLANLLKEEGQTMGSSAKVIDILEENRELNLWARGKQSLSAFMLGESTEEQVRAVANRMRTLGEDLEYSARPTLIALTPAMMTPGVPSEIRAPIAVYMQFITGQVDLTSPALANEHLDGKDLLDQMGADFWSEAAGE